MTMPSEINLELLLGRRVRAETGEPVGRIEEVRAEDREGDLVIVEYHVGATALFERLSASPLGREILGLFRFGRAREGYRVPWDKLDLSDPERPRLTCPVAELAPLE